MPGPMNEKCADCYYWDIDKKKRVDKRWAAECCYSAPGDRVGIFHRWDDDWCSEQLDRDDMVMEYRDVYDPTRQSKGKLIKLIDKKK